MVVGVKWREKVGRLSKMDENTIAINLDSLRNQFNHHFFSLLNDQNQNDDVLLVISELVPIFIKLHKHPFSPLRRFVAQILADIGMKHMEFTPQIMPILITMLKDETPAVARQAIRCGIDLFRSILVKVAIQGLYSSDLESSLESSWAWVQKFREEIYSVAFEPRSDGTRLLALKFVEALLLLYTPDPSGPSEPPPPCQDSKGMLEFNISWIRGGHPIFDVGDLRIEARQSLGLLLDQLRVPTSSNSLIIVLVNSLSAIATKRPSFYGHILPVLLGLDMSTSTNKGISGLGVHHALKKAYLSCLEFQHPSAAPWRERLVAALTEMKAEGFPEQAVHKISQINGNVECEDGSPITLEENPSIRGVDIARTNAGKKRLGSPDSSDLAADHNLPSKRTKAAVKPEQDVTTGQDNKQTPTKEDGNNAHVQQLVAMFGTLIAQGENAIGSLEILIASISVDLLAEVVMASMRNLPLNFPRAECDEEPSLDKGPLNVGRDAKLKQLLSILDGMRPTADTSLQMDSMPDTQSSKIDDIEITEVEEEQPVDMVDYNESSAAVEFGDGKNLAPLSRSSSDEVLSARANSFSAKPESPDDGFEGSGIPGLDSSGNGDGSAKKFEDINQEQISTAKTCEDFSHEQISTAKTCEDFSHEQDTTAKTCEDISLEPCEDFSHEQISVAKTCEDFSQEQISSLSGGQLERANSMSTERSEDPSSITSSAANSVTSLPPIVLPRMSAPVINLVEEEKDQIQNMAFGRIVEAYKQIAAGGGSHLHSTLLSYLAVEFPLELDPWKILQEHILLDYVNHEGHELTLRVLYRLFREAEEERDFFSSTTATSVYDTFLLTVAETLRDSFPASDKSLNRLLGEAPYLPKSLFKLLEGLCSPGSSDKVELPSGDRVTQGLGVVWGLILLRPPIRDTCLKIAMQSAVHHLEEVRMKAIRLVANKLFPLSSISPQIEVFAKEMLYSVSIQEKTTGRVDGDISEQQKDMDVDHPSAGQQSGVGDAKEQSSDTSQLDKNQDISSSSLAEAQRCMSLYFALCTKKHSLFRELFFVYKSASDTVKQAVHHQIPILVRTIGSSPVFLEIISDPPVGAESLLMQVLRTLTDGTIPSPELVQTLRKLFDTKIKDVEILIPILPYLPKDEVLLIFPHLVNLPSNKFQATVTRLLQGSSLPDQELSPAEILIAIHGIDPDRDGIPLKKVTEACNTCFEQRQIFTQQVLAKVLNQLVEQIPLPLLFMRTVLQATGAFPALVDFILEILSRLVNKQIWKYPKLWVGFLKCVQLTKPQSFGVLLQLPPAQLENALHRIAALKQPLIAHASQPNIQSSLPRSVLAVLGIAQQPQISSQAETAPTQTGETDNSDKEMVTEVSKDSTTAS